MRGFLPFCYCDLGRSTAPFVAAQDAAGGLDKPYGSHKASWGAWCLAVATPPVAEIEEVLRGMELTGKAHQLPMLLGGSSTLAGSDLVRRRGTSGDQRRTRGLVASAGSFVLLVGRWLVFLKGVGRSGCLVGVPCRPCWLVGFPNWGWSFEYVCLRLVCFFCRRLLVLLGWR